MDKKIKNLLFDLGGVIMDIRRQDCVEAFRALGLKNPESYFGEYAQAGAFKALEEGSIGIDEFHSTVRRDLPEGVTDSEIDTAFCRFLTGIPAHRLEALRRLRNNYSIYLLGNTNRIMWDSAIAEEFRKEGHVREDYFDGIITSFEARALKPDETIFRYAIDKLGIDPAETMFFDDSEANTTAAAALGFATATVLPGTEFTDYLPAE